MGRGGGGRGGFSQACGVGAGPPQLRRAARARVGGAAPPPRGSGVPGRRDLQLTSTGRHLELWRTPLSRSSLPGGGGAARRGLWGTPTPDRLPPPPPPHAAVDRGGLVGSEIQAVVRRPSSGGARVRWGWGGGCGGAGLREGVLELECERTPRRVTGRAASRWDPAMGKVVAVWRHVRQCVAAATPGTAVNGFSFCNWTRIRSTGHPAWCTHRAGAACYTAPTRCRAGLATLSRAAPATAATPRHPRVSPTATPSPAPRGPEVCPTSAPLADVAGLSSDRTAGASPG